MESPTKQVNNLGDEKPIKSKAELRAERRQKQEEQRVAKCLKMGKQVTQEALTGKGGDKAEKIQQPKSANKNEKPPTQVQAKPHKNSTSESKECTVATLAHPSPREHRVSISSSSQQQALRVPSSQRMDDPAQQKKTARNLTRTQISQMRPMLTSIPPSLQHLPCYDISAYTLSQSLKLGSSSSIKSDFIAYAHRVERAQDPIHDSYEAIWFQLACFNSIINKYRQPENEYFGRDFLHYLNRHVDFLSYCHPLQVYMRCLIDILKQRVSTFKPDMSQDECKAELLEEVMTFHQTRIHEPLKTISHELEKHVPYGSHLLVMGGTGAWILCHSLIYLHKLFSAEHTARSSRKSPLTVTVVDGSPLYAGRRLVAMLQKSVTQMNLPPMRIRYSLFTHLPTVLPQIDKVILSAQSLLSNSNVLSTVGAAGVAQMAKHFHKPLIVVMETCSFWDRKLADAFEFNHLIDPRLVLLSAATTVRRNAGEEVMRAAQNLLECVDPRQNKQENKSNADEVTSSMGSIKIYNMELDLIGKECITCIVNDFGSVLPACGSVLHRLKPGAEDTQYA